MKEEKKINVNSSYEGNQVSMSSNNSLRTTNFGGWQKVYWACMTIYFIYTSKCLKVCSIQSVCIFRIINKSFQNTTLPKIKKILKGLKILNKYYLVRAFLYCKKQRQCPNSNLSFVSSMFFKLKHDE
jgi:hypothetical protein